MNRLSVFRSLLAVAACVWLLQAWPCNAAVYQWSVAVESIVSSETNDHPRAFLWIPPACKHVRAVIVGQHNMEEEPALEHPAIRAAASEVGFAEIWITPAIDGHFDAKAGVGAHFDAMMKVLALESGYKELESAPLIPIGHSAASGFPWQYALWNPARTAAVMSVSGSFPHYRETSPPLNVPGIVTDGEYEGGLRWAADGLKERQAHPMLPVGHLGESGGTHFEFSDRKAAVLALFLKKVAQYRINPDGSLRAIDPTREGWLADRWRGDDPSAAPPGPVGHYSGNPAEAYWYFDEELAKAADQFHGYQKHLKAQAIAFVQEGKLIDPTPHDFMGTSSLHWLPLEDGVSFKLSGAFREFPPGQADGVHLLHAADASKIKVERMLGPMVQLTSDTWSVRFNRTGMNNPKRSFGCWFTLTHPGDSEFKRAIVHGGLRIPHNNSAGTEQHITFPEIPDQPVDAKTLQLVATSDAKLPVYYYVREGPAEVNELGLLTFTPIPSGARLPIKVTVVAWQFGRGSEPKIKSATPVERTFLLGGSPIDDGAKRSNIWAEAIAHIKAVEDARQAAVERAFRAAKSAPNAIGLKLCKTVGMRPEDLAGAEVRVGNWNNVENAKVGTTVKLAELVDKNGAALPGVRASISFGSCAGSGGGGFDADTSNPGPANDARLFNGLFDGDERSPTTLEMTGIPFARYDVYCYRCDDGEERAGIFQIGDTKLTIRGGKSNPEADGSGYVLSHGNLDGGNYVKFTSVTGSMFKLTCIATLVPGNDRVLRNKIVGFQIVSRD